jgi:hypothetical protein
MTEHNLRRDWVEARSLYFGSIDSHRVSQDDLQVVDLIIRVTGQGHLLEMDRDGHKSSTNDRPFDVCD